MIEKVAYCRVSTDKQEESLDNQKQYFKDFGIDEIYYDEGLTGTNINREGFIKMLTDAGLEVRRIKTNAKDKLVVVQTNREPLFKYIYTKSISRFSRNIAEATDIIRELKNKGVYVHFLDINTSTESVGGDVLLNIMFSLSENESKTISQRVRWGNVETSKKGNNRSWNNYGYKRVDNHLEVIEEEAEIVKKMFELKANGLGFRKVANELNNLGYKTRKGGNWTASSCTNIIKNPIYKGCVVRNRFSYNTFANVKMKMKDESEWIVQKSDIIPQVIDDVTWKRANKTIKENAIAKKGVYRGKTEWARKIKCSKCGKYYTKNINTSTGKIFFNCSTKKKQGTSSCNSRNIYLEDLENILKLYVGDGYKGIANRLINKLLFKTIDKEIEKLKKSTITENKDKIENNNIEIDKLKKKLKKLITVFLEQEDNEEIFAEVKEDITNKIKVLEDENKELSNPIELVNLKIEKLTNIKAIASKYASNIKDNITREEFIRDYLQELLVEEDRIEVLTDAHIYFVIAQKLVKSKNIEEFKNWIKELNNKGLTK